MLVVGRGGCRPAKAIFNNKLRRMVMLTALGLMASTAMHAEDRSMIRLSLPSADKIMADRTVEVTIHLNAPAEPWTLAVQADDQDITAYFAKDRCYQAPCEIKARLNGNVVSSGWNYLYASVEGPNASTDSDSARSSTTAASAPPMPLQVTPRLSPYTSTRLTQGASRSIMLRVSAIPPPITQTHSSPAAGFLNSRCSR